MRPWATVRGFDMQLTDPRFLNQFLHARPFELPAFLLRRVGEAVTTPPAGIAVSRFGDVVYPVDMSLHAMARKYYFQTHEMYLERAFREHLSPGDVFIDIGANMGYWSAFSAALVGPEGEVHAFEPVPRFYEQLARLADANPRYRIYANQLALGAGPSVLPMAVVEPTAGNYANFDTNIGSSSLLPGFLDHARELTRVIEVGVTSLDDYIASRNIDPDRIGLIKIDVEGFEKYCLDGMTGVLGKSGRKTPVLCEILTDENRIESLDGRKTIERFRNYGYTCLNALTLRPIDETQLDFEENILCV